MANTATTSEYRTASTRDGFRALLEMDSYHHWKNGVTYPPVLLMHGTQDMNVEPWQSYKMAARLQSTGAHARNALLRVSVGQGHGFSGRERIEARAETIAFFLHMLR